MTEIGVAYISVVPEISKGIQAAYAEASRGGRQLGEALGGGLSAGTGAGLDALKAKAQATAGVVQKATRDMAAAQKAEADATGALRVAVEKLNEAKANSSAKTSQLVAAEERVAKAQRASEIAATGARTATEKHGAALSKAEQASKSFSDSSDKTSSSVGNLSSKFGGLATTLKLSVAGLATAGVASFFRDSIDGAKEAEKAQNSLSQAFLKFPKLADTNQKALQDLNTAMAKKVAFDDDAFASGQAVLAQFGLTGQQIQDITPLLADYAAKTGVDLPTAAEQLGKGVLGNGKALKAVGIDFKDTGSAAGNLDQIMGGLRTQVGGFAESDAKTASGQSKMLALSFGEIKESVGTALLPVLQKMSEVLLTIVNYIRDNSTVMGPLLGVVAALAVGFGVAAAATSIWTTALEANRVLHLQAVAEWIGSAAAATAHAVGVGIATVATSLWAAATWVLNTALAVLTSPITLVIVAIAALVAGVIYAWNNFETFRNIVTAVWEWIQTAVRAVVDWFMTWVWPVLQFVARSIIASVVDLWQNFVDKWNAIRSVAQTVIDWFTGTLVPAFQTAWNAIKGAFQSTVDTIGGIWNQLKELAKIPINFIIQTIINNGLINGINTVAGWLKLPVHIDPVPWPPAGWAAGGWTGPGSKYDPAGVVHADEFVIKKKSRRGIESAVPGFLDALNAYGPGALGYAGGGRVRPVPGGFTTYSGHTGVDFPVPMGTSVRAFLDGVVESVRAMATSYGTYVMMNHGGGLQSIYAHLQQATVQPGQTVIAGDQVGLSDSTGNSTGPHLHFELRQDGSWFDPSGMLNGTQAITGGIFQGMKENVVNFFRDNINTLLDKIPGEGGFFRDLGVAGAKKAIDAVADFFIGKAEASDADKGTFIAGAGASQWASVALQALALAGQPDSLLPLLLHRIEVESGGNPNVTNNWDSNAKAGHASTGLMQTIPSTFAAYAGALAGRGINDPLANIYAAIMYTNDRYRGNFGRAWSGTAGYAEGGLVEPILLDQGGVVPKGLFIGNNQTGAPEALARVGAGGMTGLRIEGTLDTPWGPSQIRGMVQSELRDTAQLAAMSRRY